MSNRTCPICGGAYALQNGVYRCICCGDVQEASPTQYAAVFDGTDVVARAECGVLELTCRFADGVSAGSGYLIDRGGLAITNAHVVAQAQTYRICDRIDAKVNGRMVSAQVIAVGDGQAGHGDGIDLALLCLDAVPDGARALEIGDFDRVFNGAPVYVIGNSLGRGLCVTKGIVSDRLRTVQGNRLLMTDCAVNGGNSGGPLLDASGKVIGTVVSGIAQAEGMNFAIPIDDTMRFVRSVAYSLSRAR